MLRTVRRTNGGAPRVPALLFFVAVVVVVVVEADPCERQHPFRVGGKDLEGWRRTSKYVLSCCILLFYVVEWGAKENHDARTVIV